MCRSRGDEVSWKRRHKYLTLVVDHRRRQVVWGCEGSGQAAAAAFFSELDPPPVGAAPEHAKPPRGASEPAIMIPFGACPTVGAGHGIPGALLEPGLEIKPAIFARAGLLQAVSLDMGPGYAKSVREHAPQAVELHARDRMTLTTSTPQEPRSWRKWRRRR